VRPGDGVCQSLRSPDGAQRNPGTVPAFRFAPCGLHRSLPNLALAAGPFQFDVEKQYIRRMTKLLEQALEAVRGLPPDAQDDIARVLLQLAGNDVAAPVALSTEERAAIAASKAAAKRGEFATDEQVRATWAKHGL
jgi:hypothetical protein